MVEKPKKQKITFKSLLRLTIFLVLVYFLISFLDQQKQNQLKNDPKLSFDEIDESLAGDVLGDVYSKLPQDSRDQLENFDQTEIAKFFNSSTQYIQEKLDGFPQKQIKEIKKNIIKNISEEMIRQVEEN